MSKVRQWRDWRRRARLDRNTTHLRGRADKEWIRKRKRGRVSSIRNRELCVTQRERGAEAKHLFEEKNPSRAFSHRPINRGGQYGRDIDISTEEAKKRIN